MDIMTCIYCTTKDNLNTELTIPVDDGVKIKVKICDTHAEEATIKSAKEAYARKKSELDVFMEMAKEFGYDLSQRSTGLAVATAPTPVAVPVARPVPQQQAPTTVDDDDLNAPTAIVDHALERGMATAGGNLAGHGAVEAGRSYAPISAINTDEATRQDLRKALNGKVQLAEASGRQGMPIMIPKKRKDGLGTTIVNVVDTGGDQQLQRRFKDMAEGTKSGMHQGFKESYDVRTCPLCHGGASVKDRGKEVQCPKCKGSGLM